MHEETTSIQEESGSIDSPDQTEQSCADPTPLHLISDEFGFVRDPRQKLERPYDLLISDDLWDSITDEQKELVLARRSRLIFTGERGEVHFDAHGSHFHASLGRASTEFGGTVIITKAESD